MLPPGAQSSSVRRVHGAEACVTTAPVGRADGAAAGLGHRAETGRPIRDHDADGPPALALDADAIWRYVGLSPVEEGIEGFKELVLVDGATP